MLDSDADNMLLFCIDRLTNAIKLRSSTKTGDYETIQLLVIEIEFQG